MTAEQLIAKLKELIDRGTISPNSNIIFSDNHDDQYEMDDFDLVRSSYYNLYIDIIY